MASADLSALTTTVDPDDGTIIFSGDARLADGDTLIEADEIRYFRTTNMVVATGNVRVTRGADRMLAEQLTYNRADHTFTIDQIRLGRYPYYLAGQSAQGDSTEITINDSSISLREPGPYQPTFTADKLTYVMGDEVTAEEARLGVGGAKPLSLSSFSHDLNLPVISYLSLNAGFRSSLGAFGELGVHVPVGSGIKLGGTLGAYTERGIMVGPAASYSMVKNDHEISGNFQSGFINDRGDRQSDVLARRVPENRAYVQWWHAQDLTENLRLTGKLNYWKDSEILRDYRPLEFFGIQEPDNYLQTVYTSNNYFITAFARAQPNDFQRVQQRLPEIRFDMMPRELANGFYERFHASFAALREETPGNLGPTTRSDRFDAYYSVSKTITHEDWFSFRPIVGARVTHYSRARGGKDNYTRTLGEFGFDAELRTSSTSSYRNETWKINGIRHLFTPKLSYRYVPSADKGRPYIPPIDTLTFNTYLPPIGLGDIRHIDDLGPTNVMRVGFDNTWQTRDEEYGSRDLFVFNLATDFRFSKLPGQRTASDIHNVIAIMPAPWLQFDVYQRFTPQEFTMQEINTSLTITDGDAWSLRFSSHLLRREIEEYILQYDVRLNEVYEVIAKVHYDTRKNRFNEQAYGIRHNLGNIWSLEYLLTVYDGPRRESDIGFNISVATIGF